MFLIASTFTELEKEYFLKKLKCSHSYLEYGAGESTIFAFLEPSIKIIRSIETTFKWIETVNKNLNFTDKDVIIDFYGLFPKRTLQKSSFWASKNFSRFWTFINVYFPLCKFSSQNRVF